MKQVGSFILNSLLLAWPCAAQQIPLNSSIAYDVNDPTHVIVLTWEAIPTKHFNVLTAPALGQQPWKTLNPSPIYASNNRVRFPDAYDQTARFYQVVKLDTDPPEVWRAALADGAIGVSRQSPLKVYLRDETGIDPESIRLTVGTNPPVTLTDGRLAYANGVLPAPKSSWAITLAR